MNSRRQFLAMGSASAAALTLGTTCLVQTFAQSEGVAKLASYRVRRETASKVEATLRMRDFIAHVEKGNSICNDGPVRAKGNSLYFQQGEKTVLLRLV